MVPKLWNKLCISQFTSLIATGYPLDLRPNLITSCLCNASCICSQGQRCSSSIKLKSQIRVHQLCVTLIIWKRKGVNLLSKIPQLFSCFTCNFTKAPHWKCFLCLVLILSLKFSNVWFQIEFQARIPQFL